MNTPEPELLNVSFFIRYFSNIPEHQWCRGMFTNGHGQHCAMGHCGVTEKEYGTMGNALDRLFRDNFGFSPIIVNDQIVGPFFDQLTPKTRILAALHKIKAKQDAAKPKPAPVVHECAHMWCGGQCLYCCILQPVEKPEAVVV